MKAFKCNDCGKFYEKYQTTHSWENAQFSESDVFLNLKVWGVNDYDICPDCLVRHLHEYISVIN